MKAQLHEFAFEIKFYSVVKIKAKDRQSAEAALGRFVSDVESNFDVGLLKTSEAVYSASIYMDDVMHPLLTEVYGIDAD